MLPRPRGGSGTKAEQWIDEFGGWLNVNGCRVAANRAELHEPERLTLHRVPPSLAAIACGGTLMGLPADTICNR